MSAATVGMTHLRSLGLRAGRKNAMISHTRIGVHTMMPAKMATLKRTVKPPRAVSTLNWPPGRNGRMGSRRTSMMTGVAS